MSDSARFDLGLSARFRDARGPGACSSSGLETEFGHAARVVLHES
jgi:hypothetical protein